MEARVARKAVLRVLFLTLEDDRRADGGNLLLRTFQISWYEGWVSGVEQPKYWDTGGMNCYSHR